MITMDRIIGDERVQSIINNNPHIESNIKTAAEILQFEPNAVEAVIEASRGLINDRINVFLSYKLQDEEAATTVVNELNTFAGNKLSITYAADFKGEAGVDYKKMIHEGITKAHWFILLLPDPSAEWDWCLFETGMFRRGMITDKVNRLICLHHPLTALPSQIREFQSVRADLDTVKRFIKSVLVEKDPIPGMEAINPKIPDSRIEDIARTITQAISPPVKTKDIIHSTSFQKRIMIKFPRPVTLDKPEDLDDALVADMNDGILQMFGKVPKVTGFYTWKELISRVLNSGNDDRWVKELYNSIRSAMDGNIPEPVYATFKGMSGGKTWRPLLHAMDIRKDDVIDSFRILFIEEVSSVMNKHIPGPVQALMTTLRLAYRFRWEIIERYKDHITDDEIDEMKGLLEQMESEGRSRGNISPEELCKNFNTSQCDAISMMFSRWYKLRNPENTGELDIAIQNRDVHKVRSILNELAEMNQQFIKLSSERLEERSALN